MRLILIASIGVSFGMALVQSKSKMSQQAFMSEANHDGTVHSNFRQFFDSIIQNDLKKTKTYRNLLEREAVKEQHAFDTIKGEFQSARQKNVHNQRNSHTPSKREAPETEDLSDDILEDRVYTSKEIDGFCASGFIKDIFRKAVSKYGEYKRRLSGELRVNQILGFICANVLIRDIQSAEYKSAELDFPGEAPSGVWRRYLHESQRRAAKALRAVLSPSQYNDCADSICRSWPVGSKHAHCDERTVKVADQLRAGTLLNITEILKHEQPRFLFTVDDMEYINSFINATGQTEFPYFSFHREQTVGTLIDKLYAAPQLRNDEDKRLCGKAMCKGAPKA